MPAAASLVWAPVCAKAFVIQAGQACEAVAALLGDQIGRIVRTKELVLVVFVERDQRGDSPSHTGVAGQRGIFGARQVETDLRLGEGRTQSDGAAGCYEKVLSGHGFAFCGATLIP